MRLFIGLPVPTDVQHALQQAWKTDASEHASDRPTKPSSWHVTLAFLDDVPADRIDQIRAFVEMSMKHPPKGGFTIDGFDTFPERNPTRVVARLTPDDPKAWKTFITDLRDLVSIAAPNVDRKPWKPHISIVRQRKGHTLGRWSVEIPPIVWKPSDVAIIQSTLSQEGSAYKNLHVFPFDV